MVSDFHSKPTNQPTKKQSNLFYLQWYHIQFFGILYWAAYKLTMEKNNNFQHIVNTPMHAVKRRIHKYDLKPDCRFQNENREQPQRIAKNKNWIQNKTKKRRNFIFNQVDKFLLMVCDGSNTAQNLFVMLIKGDFFPVTLVVLLLLPFRLRTSSCCFNNLTCRPSVMHTQIHMFRPISTWFGSFVLRKRKCQGNFDAVTRQAAYDQILELSEFNTKYA